MRLSFRLASVLTTLAVAASCAQQKPAAAPAPSAGTGPAAAPAGGRGAAPGMIAQGGPPGEGRGGPPGGGRGGRGGRGGPPMTPAQRAERRDSIGALRTAVRLQLMKEIAGRENEPAGTVYKNVQVLKDVPAGRFLVMMDSTFGRGLGRNCTDCHVANRWASDSLNRKKTARFMAGMVESINNELLSKLPTRPGQSTPKINCITCHRGNPGGPGQALMP